MITAELDGQRVIGGEDAKPLYDQSRFGKLLKNKVEFSLLESMYLVEKKKIEVIDGKGKVYDKERLLKAFRRYDKQFSLRYAVFSDLRSRGYIVKTALKFGADFRVYDRGVKPGEDHAKWVVFPVHESQSHSWHEFSAKNRVAHSTKKRLLLGVVDDEGDVTYYEVKWLRP